MSDPSKGSLLGHPEFLGDTQPLVRARAEESADIVIGGTSSSASDEEDLAPGTTLGDWQIAGKIGQGGMGTVYSATHAVIGKRAAIKVVRGELCRSPLTAERFVQEARVVNQIGHPNIVDIFHIGRLLDGRPYLVMELLRGRTLSDRMADGRVPATEAIDLLLEVCAAIGAAHQQGVVHRDLKPDNIILIESAGRTTVKVVDWGIAKLTDGMPVALGMTTTGVMLGTPQYVSPEQARGKNLDWRTDIYSLGAIAYEIFLEGPPFVADNVADVVSMHLREAPPPPSDVWPDIPPSLEKLLLRMLAKEAEQRPSIADVISSLQLVRRDLDVRAQSTSGRRVAAGSMPPPTAVVAVGSGAVPVIIESTKTSTREPTVPLGLRTSRARAAQTHPTPITATAVGTGTGPAALDATGAHPRPARWPWMIGALAVIGAAVAAIAVAIGGPGKPASAAEHAGSAALAPAKAAPATTITPGTPATDPTAKAPGAATPEAGASGSAATAATPGPGVTPPGAGTGAAPTSPGAGRPTLDLHVTPPTARVVIDGTPVETERGALRTMVSAGAHEVRIEARGYTPYARSLDIVAPLALDVHLAPIRRRTPTTAPGDHPTTPVDPNATIEPFP